MNEKEVVPALSREKHHSEWPNLFQNGNWTMLSVLSRLKGKFPLLMCVWPVNITPHFSRTMNSREWRLNRVNTANAHTTHNLRTVNSRERRLNRVNTANTHTTHNFSSRSDEGLTLEESALKLLMVANFTLSTQLIRLKDHIKVKLTI